MRSIQSRLLLALSLALGAALLALGLVGGQGLRGLAEDYVARRLSLELESILAAIYRTRDGRAAVRTASLDPVYHRPFSGRYFVIFHGSHEIRSRSLWDERLRLPSPRPPPGVRVRIAGPQEQRLLVLGAHYRKQGMALEIYVAEDLAPIEAGIRRLMTRFVGIALLAAVTLLLLQAWVVHRALLPLRAAAEAVRRLHEGETDELDVHAAPREIAPLLEEIHHLIGVVRRRLARSRNAIGNLAHALKNPLALARQSLTRPPFAGTEEGARILEQLDTVARLVDRELRRARIAGHPDPGRRTVLAPEVRELAALVQRLHDRPDLAVELALPEACTFAGDRDDLIELLGNLLDNAAKWARRRIRVEARVDGGELVLIVDDDGPGMEESERAHLTRRGRRADESAPGHGLGLAIVADIAAAYGGRLALGRAPRLGGLRAEVHLPAAPP